jgi:hypothetical protein
MRDCVNEDAHLYVNDRVLEWKFLKTSNRFKHSAISDHSMSPAIRLAEILERSSVGPSLLVLRGTYLS